CGLDAELAGLVHQRPDQLMLLKQHLLLLGQFLELQIDVAGLGVATRMQTVDLDAELGDSIFVGPHDLFALTVERPRNVGCEQERGAEQTIAAQKQRKHGIEKCRMDAAPRRPGR
ncbi:MAG: hypothetical protein MO852_08615, partial [Candidatus Devosia euplotis]|nr:hypothetical protein [Candidatus Devosia euplotis]